jgi:serine/threonine-protein kinase
MTSNVAEELRFPEPGEQILGKYQLIRLVGEGGMGAVFEAEHLVMRQRVAIKVLLPTRSTARDAARFSREARAASQLRSAHVARVLDVDRLESGLPFMVMEFLLGRDLEEELRIRGQLGVSEAVDYVIQACEAVAEAHARGIIHRDLKPGNLFLCEERDLRIVKVLDFGISKMQDEANVTITCTALGTPLYMSPEQIRNAKEVDHRTDIWSLGVILFELIAGRPPFEGGPTAVSVAIAVDPPPWLRTLRPEVPIELERVVMQALEKHPARRFATVADLAQALRRFASDPEHPGRVRLEDLPRDVPMPVGLRASRTATTLDGPGRLASSWSTNADTRERRARLSVVAASGAALLGAAALLVTVLVRSASSPEAAPALRSTPSAPAGPEDGAHAVSMGAARHAEAPASAAPPAITPVPSSSATRSPDVDSSQARSGATVVKPRRAAASSVAPPDNVEIGKKYPTRL